MGSAPKPYPNEFRDDVVRVAGNREPAIHLKQIDADFGICESYLTNWMKTADFEDGVKPATTTSENADEILAVFPFRGRAPPGVPQLVGTFGGSAVVDRHESAVLLSRGLGNV